MVSRNHSLDEIFHPRSVAVVGVSSKEARSWDSWLTRLLHFGFSGPIYPINPNADTILGLKAYPSVRAVPGPVDYCIVQVPAERSLDVLADCAAKGVKAVHFFTAGFTETASPEGKRLEEEMRRLQRQSGIRVLGPNCMGLYVPDAGLTIVPGMPKEKGNVAFITQSGFNAHLLVRMAAQRGARFSKVVSYGNALDLAEAELLEYLARDAETDIVACYIEGVRDGPRFVRALEACLESKPVVMIKAGLTAAGARAVRSHTASLAGAGSTWEALYRQTGAIRAGSVEEVADIILPFYFKSLPKGRRVGIVGAGGGMSVIATDLCEQAGLVVPPLTEDTQRQLGSFTPEAGASVRNPVDSPVGWRRSDRFVDDTMHLVASDPNVDFMLVHCSVDQHFPENKERAVRIAEAAAKAARVGKPIAVALYVVDRLADPSILYEPVDICVEAGIPTFYSLEAAARAFGKCITFTERRG